MGIKDLQAVCDEEYGKRGSSGDQEATGGAGVFANVQIQGHTIFFMCKQGGVFHGKAQPGIVHYDARNHVVTTRKKNEWTGYHSEMVIVSAMLSMLRSGNMMIGTGASGMQQYNKFLGTMIAANAACCAHCHAMLIALGIERPDPAGKASLTGWWNPLTDERFPHGSTEFGYSIPGGTDLKNLPKTSFS